MANSSATTNRRRLRLWSVLFFLSLALPSGLLVYKAYDQLKWEAFHRHQLQAEEIAGRVDQRFDALIRREDARAFTDFAFLTLAGDPSAEFVQRSPLADLPARSDIPGLIGYFQVDADGIFTTPLLPRAGTSPLAVGIPADELIERRALQQRIESILTSNRLVDRRQAEPADVAAVIPQLTPVQPDSSRKTERGFSPANRQAKRVNLSERREPFAREQDRAYNMEEEAPASPAPEEPLTQDDRPAMPAPSQAGFDELYMQRQTVADNFDSDAVDGLSQHKGVAQLGEPATTTGRATGSTMQVAPVTAKRRAVRKERSAAPEPAPLAPVSAGAMLDARQSPATRVRTFESEIDPFDLSRLDSGHFVLFRRVWRNGQRLIQGAVIEAYALTSEIVGTIFRDTSLSRISDLQAAFRGNVLLTIGANGSRSYSPGDGSLAGTLLYRTRLSAPLSELELAFTVQQLNAGAGAWVVIWLAMILFLILVIGTWLMYRLGARQLDLVQQQQGFIYAVSHELKTPLTSIRMYSEMLREGWARDDKRMTYYGFIHDESERLSRLINNVLQLSRMSQDSLRVELEPMGSRALMELVRAKVSSQIEQAGFQFIEDCTEDRVIQVDPDAFIQIIINLVDNALKFSANAQPRLIELGCSVTPDGKPFFSVRDHGPGIPRRQVNRIFRLFYRLENELTRSTQGTGIGLALVRELAGAMNARMQVINRRPGAEFRIVFPLYTSRGSR